MRVLLAVLLKLIISLSAAQGAAMWLGGTLPPAPQLAYSARLNGDFDILLMDLNQRLVVNLTKTTYRYHPHHLTQDQLPAWSPDGARIAFQSSRAGNEDIWIMDTFGGNLQQVTTHLALDMHPEWAADGCCLLYQSWRDNNFEIMEVRLSTDGNHEHTRLTDNRSGERHPIYIAQGTQILYASDFENPFGNFNFFLMNRDGSGQRPVSYNREDFNALNPTLSPNGVYVLFDGFNDNTLSTVFLAQANGRGVATQLIGSSDGRGQDAYMPMWSRDGRSIYFVSTRDGGDSDIYRVPFRIDDLSVGTPERLTFSNTIDIQPVERPR